MFAITEEFEFEAAHRLPAHDGKCARLHGHSWKMRVIVRGLIESGPETGMVMDHGDISPVVRPFVDQFLDYQFLNTTTGLKNPTSEELARFSFYYLQKLLPSLIAVEIDGTCTGSCRYENT